MTDVAVQALSLEQARDLTDEVKADAAALWAKLLTLYEGKAHEALGYSSWADYYEEEFGESKSRGYQLLEAARVDRALSDSTMVERPAGERVAREMAPVLKDEGPEVVEEVWGEVVEQHGPAPTATQVREVVTARREETPDVGPRKQGQQSKLVSGIAEKSRHIYALEPHLDLEAISSLPEEEKHRWKQELSAARTVLSRVIGAL